MMDFIGKKQWFFLSSAILIVAGIISLAIFGLNLHTDFASGTSMVLQFSPPIEQSSLAQAVDELGYGKITPQPEGETNFRIQIAQITRGEAQELAEELARKLGSDAQIIEFASVPPAVGAETARNAGIAVIVAAVAMLFYIVWAFRRMPKPFRWGSCAVIALVHNVFIIVGIFSLLGWLAGVKIDALFITGLLAVVGYSINNTVVVFDRIRENVSRHTSTDFAETVNTSLTDTLARCLNSALTTLFVLLALFLFGGATIHYFVLVLLLGVIIGTYSSICVAGPLLVVWERHEWSALLPWARTRT